MTTVAQWSKFPTAAPATLHTLHISKHDDALTFFAPHMSEVLGEVLGANPPAGNSVRVIS